MTTKKNIISGHDITRRLLINITVIKVTATVIGGALTGCSIIDS